MAFAHLEDIHLVFISYLAVNKLLTEKTHGIFNLIADHFCFMKYTLNSLHKII